jgi:hypothetical protein
MPDKEKQGAEFPLGGVFVVLALIFGWFIIPDQPYKSSRQIQDVAKPNPPVRSLAEARLWEDPFSVRERVPVNKPMAEVSDLGRRIRNRIGQTSTDEILVLSVMVAGGGYPENVEARRRSRHAVLSALAERGYFPRNPDQLDFFKYSFGSNDVLIPYESFSLGAFTPVLAKNSHIFVLWLDENSLRHNPFWRMGELIVKIKKSCGTSSERIKFDFLGPANSDTLKSMLIENAVSYWDRRDDCYLSLQDVTFYCWGATAGDADLLEGNLEGLIIPFTRSFPARFLRMTNTDGDLVRAAIKELSLRRIDAEQDHIFLISDWDTAYGRTLANAFLNHAGRNGNVRCFTYMRGIDGRVPKSNGDDTTAESSSQGNKKDSPRDEIEKPVGNSQFDYLRRLAKQMLAESRRDSKSVRAIGVLGSDIYDKLLVLQAISDLFPRAVFFTTDLDARFLHPTEQEWSRNLVIISTYDLKLAPALQSQTPPFRDSYQTALFFSTKMSTAWLANESDLSGCLRSILKPKIFEIGRTEPVELPIEAPDEVGPAIACNYLMRSESYLRPDESGPFGLASLKVVLPYFLPVVLWGFLAIVYREAARHWEIEDETKERFRFAIWGVIALSGIGYAVYAIAKLQEVAGEPLHFLEGVSIWPSVYLRVITLALALFFIRKVIRRSMRLETDLQPFFENSKESQLDPSDTVWEDYRNRGKPLNRLKRVAVMGLPYSALCLFIILSFGGLPFVPSRGEISWHANWVSLVPAILSFIVLLFLVIDETGTGNWLIRKFLQGYTGWSSKMKNAIAQDLGVSEAEINERIGIDATVKITTIVNQCIYYPIIIIMMLWLSRLSYFDRWDMPLGLLIVILCGLILAISCAIRLGRKAEAVRKNTLNRLWEKQMRIAAEEHGRSAKQIELLTDYIKNIRSGAFVPFIEQPWVRATLMFLTSGSGLVALQYLPWFQ